MQTEWQIKHPNGQYLLKNHSWKQLQIPPNTMQDVLQCSKLHLLYIITDILHFKCWQQTVYLLPHESTTQEIKEKHFQ